VTKDELWIGGKPEFAKETKDQKLWPGGGGRDLKFGPDTGPCPANWHSGPLVMDGPREPRRPAGAGGCRGWGKARGQKGDAL